MRRQSRHCRETRGSVQLRALLMTLRARREVLQRVDDAGPAAALPLVGRAEDITSCRPG